MSRTGCYRSSLRTVQSGRLLTAALSSPPAFLSLLPHLSLTNPTPCRYDELAPRVLPMIVDGVHFVNQAYADGKRILAEGANAAMLDLDYGTFPFVT